MYMYDNSTDKNFPLYARLLAKLNMCMYPPGQQGQFDVTCAADKHKDSDPIEGTSHPAETTGDEIPVTLSQKLGDIETDGNNNCVMLYGRW